MSNKRQITSADDIELRPVVKFCVRLKLSPSEILKKIEISETVLTGGKTYVYKCHGRFREGMTSVYDDERTSPPTSGNSLSEGTEGPTI
jgi:hypothetical protein